jgi:dTMP kinase
MKIETGLVLGIEGADGSGKSTVSNYIAKQLQERGYIADRVPVIEGSKIGIIHRSEYISRPMNPVRDAVGMLYSVTTTLEQHIRNHLEHGNSIIFDRTLASTGAYQLYANGFDWMRPVYEKTMQDPIYSMPVNIYLEVAPEIAMKRMHGRASLDVIEKRGISYQEKIIHSYRRVYEDFPHKLGIVINTNDMTTEQVCEAAWQWVSSTYLQGNK